MTTLIWQTGTRCLRSFVVPAVFAVATLGPAVAQDAPKPDVRNMLDSFRGGQKTAAEAKEACDQYADWYAKKLVSQPVRDAIDGHGESWLVNDLIKRLALQPHHSPFGSVDYSKHPERVAFVDQFGKVLTTALEGPATQNGDLLVRINATRMIAEVCRSGYDGAAEACIRIITKPDENDAVRFYALQGLKNLFFIQPNPTTPNDAGIPEKTVFQKDNSGGLTPLERKAIQTLIDYIFRQPTEMKTDVGGGDPGDAGTRQPARLKPQDLDAIFYVRREAVRGLALVRVQQVRDKGKVVSQPALALLKVTRGDGLNPTSVTPQGPDWRAVGERLEAIIGFCNLVPPKSDRDMNIDYAVYHIGRALQEVSPLYKFESRDTSTPWKIQALWLRDALTTWKTRAGEMRLENAKLIDDLFNIVSRDIIDPIDANRGDLPNPANLDQWLKANPPKSKSLFKNDEKSTVNVP